MDRQRQRYILLMFAGVILIGGLLAGVFVVQRGYSVLPGTLGEIDAGETCLLVWLPMIERAIGDYQAQHEGENPDDLAILYEQYGLGRMSCDYVYRGADLTAAAPADMILVYDQEGNHPGYRNVLSARKVDFLVDENAVSRAEYRTVCVSALMSRDPNELDIRRDKEYYLHVDANGRYLVDGLPVAPEKFMDVFRQLVLDYKSGKVADQQLEIWVKNVAKDWWERKAWVRRSRRFQRVSETEFAGWIERDNEIRRELGLAEKEKGK